MEKTILCIFLAIERIGVTKGAYRPAFEFVEPVYDLHICRSYHSLAGRASEGV